MDILSICGLIIGGFTTGGDETPESGPGTDGGANSMLPTTLRRQRRRITLLTG